MDVKTSLAAQGYAQAFPATQATPSARGTDPFADFGTPPPEQDPILRGIGTFADQLSQAEDQSRRALTGGADPHALVEALASTQLAVETATTLRDRVVAAYQEILRMPV